MARSRLVDCLDRLRMRRPKTGVLTLRAPRLEPIPGAQRVPVKS